MEVIKNILSELKIVPDIDDLESIHDTDVFQFVIENSGYEKNNGDLNNYYTLLASTSISSQLYKQSQYGAPCFEEDAIYELLLDRDDDEYLAIFEWYFGKQKHLEHHKINHVDLFFGENLKMEYRLLVKILAQIITSELNAALEKLKRHLSQHVESDDWYTLFIDSSDVFYLGEEKELIDNIVEGVLL